MRIDWDTYHTKGIKSTYLFRFMKPKWLLKFIRTGNMSMARMDTFEDKLEGVSISNIDSIGLSKLLKSKSKESSLRDLKKLKSRLQNKQQSNYVCCWYLADRESIAMWNLYGGKDGLAIRIDRRNLQKRIKNQLKANQYPPNRNCMIAGKVVYQNYIGDPSKNTVRPIKYLSYRKDESFGHEREYRIVLSLNKPKPGKKHERYNFSLRSMLDLDIRIIASPKMSNSALVKIQNELIRIDPSLKLQKSELLPWYQFFE